VVYFIGGCADVHGLDYSNHLNLSLQLGEAHVKVLSQRLVDPPFSFILDAVYTKWIYITSEIERFPCHRLLSSGYTAVKVI